MSNLIDHAQRELELVGNDEAMNQGILAMVAVFSTMGHSGSSAEYTTQVLAKLLRYENLTSLTDDPSEWNLVSDGHAFDEQQTWQSRRNPEAFSHNEGVSYYLLSEREKDWNNKVFHSTKHVEPKTPIELTEATIYEVSLDTEDNPHSTGEVIVVHDPACAVALNPGLMSAWMFCKCRPSMLGE